jgi:uncharacterized membrane protein YjfL (UPF0719 family)
MSATAASWYLRMAGLDDRLTPGHLWKEIVEEQNRALAIVVGAFTLGIALIIAASISG